MAAFLVFLQVLIGLVMAAVLCVLIAGVVAMARGGEFNARYGNWLMRWRVILQGVAVALLGMFLLLSFR